MNRSRTLAQLASAGIHDPRAMPFDIAWTDGPSPELEPRALRWWWRQRAEWEPERWTFTGAVFVDGEPAGVQDLVGEDVAQLRVVRTGSGLGRRFQGRGVGREKRAAILHLAFAGLDAQAAVSSAFADNPAWLAVSRALGYRDDGETTKVRRGVATPSLNLRLDRAQWERRRRDEVVIEGLGRCRPWFGIGPAAPALAPAG